MIKLSEIIHTIKSKHEEGLSDIDNWKVADADFMTDMGFESGGACHFILKNPLITVCHKKGVGFIMEDKSQNKTITFPKFKELIEYFSKYEQKFENMPYNE